ncbi:transposase, partial [Limosilactobacillus galli]|uniref:transposase n=1 Tax=Limosilactobacillus galli TaxID=2991834 RepID=UPI0038CC1999
KALKGRSAFIFLRRHPEIRQSQYWGCHLWSPSYYMSTLGNMSNTSTIKNTTKLKNALTGAKGAYPS